MKPTLESFLKDVSRHKLTVLHDDGVYRHLRFKKPESTDMYFDIVTWPWYLAYSGDMGCYVFSRITDMLQFFRDNGAGPPRINLGYWHEKVEAQARHDGVKEYREEKFREQVNHWLDMSEATPEQRQAVELEVMCHADDGEARAMQAACDFEHDGFRLTDFWEADCTDYTYRYIWCCYALVWGIRQYDAAKASRT